MYQITPYIIKKIINVMIIIIPQYPEKPKKLKILKQNFFFFIKCFQKIYNFLK